MSGLQSYDSEDKSVCRGRLSLFAISKIHVRRAPTIWTNGYKRGRRTIALSRSTFKTISIPRRGKASDSAQSPTRIAKEMQLAAEPREKSPAHKREVNNRAESNQPRLSTAHVTATRDFINRLSAPSGVYHVTLVSEPSYKERQLRTGF